jgi:undecaprenyl diphosphate synthase
MEAFASLQTMFTAPNIKKIKLGNIPNHIAIIMDGNGRWALKRKLPRLMGHKKGAETLHEIVIACKDIGVKYLTVFSFSTENWQRPQTEVDSLMHMFVEVLKNELPGLIRNEVKLNMIGSRDSIPEDVLLTFKEAEEKTKNNKSLIFNVAFNYGSRQEIFDGIIKLFKYCSKNNIEIEKEEINNFSKYLYTGGLPDPDLLIRTSGEFRISNFLLWQIAYSELYFTKVLWPDFYRKQFFKAIYSYQKRVRRYGKL